MPRGVRRATRARNRASADLEILERLAVCTAPANFHYCQVVDLAAIFLLSVRHREQRELVPFVEACLAHLYSEISITAETRTPDEWYPNDHFPKTKK